MTTFPGRRAELAKVVNRKGRSITRGGMPRGIHSLWLAADALLAGDLATAAKLLDEPAAQPLTGSYRFMRPGMRDLFPLATLYRWWRRPKMGHCRKCGYDLRGIPSERCPECGTPLLT